MNATETQDIAPAIVEGEETPASLAELIDQVDDGSTLVEGITADEIAEPIHKAARAVKSGWTRLTNSYKGLAEALAHGRRNVLTPEGRPDWAGETGTWKAIARSAVDVAFVDLTKGERDKVTGAVRQHLNRTYLEIAIRAYVASATTLDGEPLYPTEEDMGTEAFLLAVRRQYLDAGLAVPTRYQTPEDKQNAGNGGGGPGNGPKNALTAAWNGIQGLKQVVPAMGAYVALRAVSELVERVTTGEGEVKNRAKVAGLLTRVMDSSAYGVKFLTDPEKVTDADRAAFTAAAWNEKDEKAAASLDA